MAVHSGLKLAQALRLSPSLGRLRPKIRVQRLRVFRVWVQGLGSQGLGGCVL